MKYSVYMIYLNVQDSLMYFPDQLRCLLTYVQEWNGIEALGLIFYIFVLSSKMLIDYAIASINAMMGRVDDIVISVSAVLIFCRMIQKAR